MGSGEPTRSLLLPVRLPFIKELWILERQTTFGADDAIEPVTPNASPEARALLEFLYNTSGKYTLTGQHNYPNTKDRNSQFAADYIGKMPAIWSTDWGHAEAGNSDSYLARPDIVEEAKRQHHKGSLVTICWHAVPPTADEPVTFRRQRDADPEALASVQGQLLDWQFKDVLTPGTELHKRYHSIVFAPILKWLLNCSFFNMRISDLLLYSQSFSWETMS